MPVSRDFNKSLHPDKILNNLEEMKKVLQFKNRKVIAAEYSSEYDMIGR